ncbi:MAG: hypothetical protein M3346_04365 [Actinomycetota bacterium]|nr:hypothetical protein [Actinomycetota bacterium]
MSQIQADVVSEGERLAARAAEQGLPLRLLGGVAIRLRARGELPPIFLRDYGDIDWITARGTSRETQRFFAESGYSPQVRFNALNGQERLMFHDDINRRRLDVFVGTFRMSHEIPMDDRLEISPVTIPLAELAMTKLQVAELNEKDVKDALTLFYEYPVDDGDDSAINQARIASLCANDWGLWRTLTANLETCVRHLDGYDLPVDDKTRMAERLNQLLDAIQREPKSRKWRLRAKIGDRKRWYELPEEVTGGPE